MGTTVVLDRAAFHAWLAGQAPGTRVGEPYNAARSTLANYLRSLGLGHVLIFSDRWANMFDVYPLDPWAQSFVAAERAWCAAQRHGGMGTGHPASMTAAAALAVLDTIEDAP